MCQIVINYTFDDYRHLFHSSHIIRIFFVQYLNPISFDKDNLRDNVVILLKRQFVINY